MYATCLFCNSALGANEAIEHFPVGRRLAYDAAAGRLWVVCRSCARWNLSPLETRWEAIEEAERAFRGTKLRVSSDNIGLAQLSEGTELVRIGKPIKTEFMAWRYGDQFGERYRKARRLSYVSLSVAATTTGLMSAMLWKGSLGGDIGMVAFQAGTMLNTGHTMLSILRTWRTANKLRAAVRDDSGKLIRLTAVKVGEASIIGAGQGRDWRLRVPRYDVKRAGFISRMLGVPERARIPNEPAILTGDAALRALATLLPHVNSGGAKTQEVKDAMMVVNDTQNLPQLLHKAVLSVARHNGYYLDKGGPGMLAAFPANMRLALEMSVHEDDERRAMDGELHELEQRWRDADAIAKIADNLLLPDAVSRQLDTLRDERSE